MSDQQSHSTLFINDLLFAFQQPDEEEASAEVVAEAEADPEEKTNAKKEERKQRKLKRKMAASDLAEPTSQKKKKTTTTDETSEPEQVKPEVSPKPKAGKKKTNGVAKPSEKATSPVVNGGSGRKKAKKSKTG